MSDGSQQQAKVAWVDRSSGTAVLDIDEPTPTLASGQAATLSKGDEVVAAGTNTKGKVDQVGVQAIADDGTRMSHLLRVKMDAPVADGAVLLDRSGRAVGICIGHVQSDGTAMLAAPIELARAATGATPDPDGSRRFAWLGITGRTATPVDLAPPTTVATTTTTPETVASSAPTTAASETTTTIEAVTATPESGPASTDVTTTTTTSTTTVPTSSTSTVPPSTTVATTTANMPSGGALIVAVEDGSPAALAGLEVGDVVVAVDDVPVSSMNALVLLVRERQVGGTVHLTVERAGQLLELSAVLGDRPGN
jgi:S1-C subfamily serine protease